MSIYVINNYAKLIEIQEIVIIYIINQTDLWKIDLLNLYDVWCKILKDIKQTGAEEIRKNVCKH